MPDTYIKKSERERQARIDKSIQTLLALCDDPKAAPEQRLGAVKLLRPIEELQEQLHIKNERISEQDKEILKLKSELEVKTKELELARKELETAAKDKKRIEEPESNNKTLTDKLEATKSEKDAAIKRAEQAEADVNELTRSLKILVDEFVPPQARHSTALQHFDAHGTKLSTHWYRALGLENPLRYKREMKQLKELIADARKQKRPEGPVYLASDAEVLGDIFLYRVLLQKDKWLQKALVDFFQSERADYSKWLHWHSGGQSSATDNKSENLRFRQARHDYNAALGVAPHLTRIPKLEAASDPE
jgi:seryl-tRNA synthetase